VLKVRKRILITGGSGLVGSHLIAEFKKDENYELFLISRDDNFQNQNSNINSIKIDFSKDWDVNELPQDLFAIIHLSQAENFRDFPEKANEIFYINTLSTLKIVDFAVKSKVEHFIYASSGGVYWGDGIFAEEQEFAYQREMGFYIGTKYCSEVILKNYYSLLNVQILRFFFVYGKGQHQNMLIPRLVNNIKNGNPISLQGENGMCINPIHATDAAHAILASLELKGSRVLNVGGAEVLSLREICEVIGEAVNKVPNFIIDQSKITPNLIGDIAKSKELLVTPLIKFENGIKTLL